MRVCPRAHKRSKNLEKVPPRIRWHCVRDSGGEIPTENSRYKFACRCVCLAMCLEVNIWTAAYHHMRRGLWFTKYSKQICDVMDRGPSHHDAMVLLDMMSWRSWRTVQVHDWAFSQEYSISRQSMQDPVAPRRWQKHYMPHRFRQDPAESRLLRNVRASSAVNFIKTQL